MARTPYRRRPWTDEERRILEDMLRSGATVAMVAQRLGRRKPSVFEYAERVCGGILALRQSVRTLRQVAALFGADYAAVRAWIDLGWLATRRNSSPSIATAGHKPRNQYLVLEAALTAFIRNRRTWMAWRAEDVTDATWRARAQQQRHTTHGQWLAVKDVAQRLAYDASTVQSWLRLGRLPGAKYRGDWYVWSLDLVGWTPPLECPQVLPARCQATGRWLSKEAA